MSVSSTTTRLSEEDARGLIPIVLTHNDLNRLEQINIMQARTWAMRRSSIRVRDIFSQQFVKQLHRKMFDQVWRWAGDYRQSDKNIGVHHASIAIQIQQLLGNADYWLNEQIYGVTELAVIFHHRLVKIRPFINGNGRHARLFAEVITSRYNGKKLTWGRISLSEPNEVRKRYIDALRKADGGRDDAIIAFAQS